MHLKAIKKETNSLKKELQALKKANDRNTRQLHNVELALSRKGINLRIEPVEEVEYEEETTGERDLE